MCSQEISELSVTDARIGRLQEERGKSRSELAAIVSRLRLASAQSGDEETGTLYLRALEALNVDELTHPDVTAVTRNFGLKTIPHADSFWRSIVTRRRKKQLGTVPEKHLGLSKAKDEAFARSVGVATVNTVYSGSFRDIPRSIAPSVLKPVESSDSLGAFYIFEDSLFSIANSIWIPTWDDLERQSVIELEVANVEQAEWHLQELVTCSGNPAPDYKFYCFYGEVGVVLEVSRFPQQQYAYFDGDLTPIQFRADEKPRFQDVASTTINNGGIDERRLQTVRNLSLEIPVPFMRIDFLNSDDDLIFCEFSSAPGMSHALVSEQDTRLGKLYQAAEVRLVNDLLAGKKFEAFVGYSNWEQLA